MKLRSKLFSSYCTAARMKSCSRLFRSCCTAACMKSRSRLFSSCCTVARMKSCSRLFRSCCTAARMKARSRVFSSCCSQHLFGPRSSCCLRHGLTQSKKIFRPRCACLRYLSETRLSQIQFLWRESFIKIEKEFTARNYQNFAFLTLPHLSISSRRPELLFISEKPILNR